MLALFGTRWPVGVAGLLLLATGLCGCAATLSVSPAVSAHSAQVVQLPPQVRQQGKAGRITLPWSSQAMGSVDGAELVLMPAGPYVSHRLALASPPLALASAGRRVYVASADRALRVLDFSADGAVRELARLADVGGRVTGLSLVGQHLLLVLADGRVRVLDVSGDQPPRPLADYTAPAPVRAARLLDDSVYLLLPDGQRLQRLRLTAGDSRLRPVAQWTLPMAATAFAVRDDHAWLVTARGLAAVSLAGQQARQQAFATTSGRPSAIQLRGNQALVAAGAGGLQVFDISRADSLRWLGSYNKRGAIAGMVATADGAVVRQANGVLLSLALHNPELPSAGAAFKPGAPVLAMAAQGEAVIVASRQGLQRVVMAGDGSGAISPAGLNLGGSRRGVIRGDILYVADWFSGLHLYDISNPQQPRHLSNYHTPGSSKGVALMGDYALVGDDDQGLQIIDIHDPRHPVWTAELPPEAMARLGLAYTMKRVGRRLYLADHRGGFHIIDLSDIRHPRRLGGYDTPGKAWAIDVRDDIAYVADDRAGLLLFDVSDPARPQPFAQFDPSGQAEDVVLQGDRAYLAFFDQGLYVLDIHDPRQPQVLSHLAIPGNARGIALGDGLIYVAGWESGLHIVDTRDPKAPRIIGSLDTDGDAWGINVKGRYAYVLDWWGGIKVVDVSQPTQPTLVGRYQSRGTLRQLRAHGSYLYAASGAGGLQVYDIKNPIGPIWAKGLDVAGDSRDLWIEDDRAYLAAGDGGLAVFDILSPFNARRLGGFDTPGAATLVRAWNEYAYVADSRAGLLVLDMRDPLRPVEVARYPQPVRDLWVDEHGLWRVTAAGISQWGFAADGRLVASDTWDAAGDYAWLRSAGERVVAAGRQGQVSIWRRGAHGLQLLGQYDAGETLSDLQLAGNSIYLLGQRSGLMAVDISRPAAPRRYAVYPPTGQHERFALAKGAAFFAGETKLVTLRLLPATRVGVTAAGQLTLQWPADLPRGSYHLLVRTADGRQQLRPNALKLQFADPRRRHNALDTYRQLLKTPLKPPPEPDRRP